MDLYGTVARASAANIQTNKFRTAMQLLLHRTPDFYKPHLREVQYFVQCLEQGEEPSPTAEESIRDLEAISLAYSKEVNMKY
jgi:hypothetical protein